MKRFLKHCIDFSKQFLIWKTELVREHIRLLYTNRTGSSSNTRRSMHMLDVNIPSRPMQTSLAPTKDHDAIAQEHLERRNPALL